MTTPRRLTTASFVALLGLGAWNSCTEHPEADPVTVESGVAPTALKPSPTTQAPSSRALPELDPRVIEAWKADTTPNEDADVDPEQLADDEERDAMLAEDRLSEQATWRSAWLSEQEDANWTRAVSEEMQRDAETLASGHVDIHDVSCRETVCRFYLDLANLEDADAFMSVERDPDLHYEFQSMNPGVEDTEPNAKHNFEVLVAREDAFDEA